MRAFRRLAAALLFFAAPCSLAATFTVTTDSDDGPGSLRWAIADANASANGDAPDTIAFAIPGAGPHVIRLLSPLPAIVDPVLIDGTTQPGAAANTRWDGFDAVLAVELDGALAGRASGLVVRAGHTVVRGLAVHGFAGDGIRIEGREGTRLEGNRIGSDTGRGVINGGSGVAIVDSTDNVIGGLEPAARNSISANGGAAISVSGRDAGTNAILGNRLARNVDDAIRIASEARTIAPPQLRSATRRLDAAGQPAGTRIVGSLEGLPHGAYRIEVFSTAAVSVHTPATRRDAEKRVFVAEIATDGSGRAELELLVDAPVDSRAALTATATDAAGSTSELSAPIEAPASTKTWNNASGGNWSLGTNWNPNGAPAATDDAVITLAGSYTVTLDVTTTVATLTLGAGSGAQTLAINSTTLTLNAASSVNANGVLALGGGTINGAGDLSVGGTFNWTSGTLAGTGNTTVTGPLTFSGSAFKGLNGRAMTTPAGTTVTWTGAGNIGLGSGGAVTNGGTWDCQSDASLYNPYGGNGTYTNNGTFKKSAGSGSTAVSITFNDASTVKAQSGTITFSGSGTHSGTFDGNAGTVSFTAGTQDLNAGTSFTGNVQLNNATFNVNAPVSAAAFTFAAGTLQGASTFTTSGLLTWTGGTMAGAGSSTANAGISFSGTNVKGINGRTLVTPASTTVMWTGTGNVALGGGGRITNGGTWDAQSDASLYNPYGGSGTFTNNGTFRKSAGTGTTALSTSLDNAGSVQAQSGTIAFNANGAHTGSFDGNAGLVSFNAGTHDLNAGSTFTGSTQLNGATLNANVPISAANFTFAAGTLQGASTFTTSGLLTWTGGTMAGAGSTTPNGGIAFSGTTAKGISGRTLITPAATTVTWAGTGNVALGNGGVITNNGTWDAQADASLYNPYGGTATFTNNATFKKSAGTGTTAVSVTLNNANSVKAQSGTITFSGNGTHTGNFDGNAGVVSFTAGTHDLNAGTSFTNATQLNGATLNVNAPVSAANFTFAAGTLQGASTFTTSGLLTWTGGTMAGAGSTTPNGGIAFSGTTAKGISGRTLITPAATTVAWAGTGNVALGSGGVITNNGTWDAQADASLYNPYGGTATFTNNATFKKSAGTGTTAVSVTLNNANSVKAQSGTITFSGNGTHTGNFDGNAGLVNFTAGTHDFNAGASLTGSTQLGGATLNVNSPVSAAAFTFSAGTLQGASTFTVSGLLTWTAGTMSGSGTTTANGGISFSGTAAKGVSGRTLITPAATTVAWAGTGNVALGSGGVITNGGTWDAQADASIYNPYGGAATFTNNGAFKKSAGGGTTNVNVAFTTSGSVSALSGTLSYNGGFTQTAGTTTLNGGALTSSTAMNINGGTFTGIGTASANVTSAGQVAPGVPVGTLTISGNYTQAAGGAFNVDIGGATPGTGFDQLLLTGTAVATLAGTLNPALVNGYLPPTGTDFTVMTYVSRSGTFSTVTQPGVNCTGWNARYDANAVVLTSVHLPMEIAGQRFATDRKTMSWTAALAYPGTTYDVSRGAFTDFPIGSQPGTETCLAQGIAGTQLTDASVPAAKAGFWYLVRERVTGCGVGTYGYATSGAERITTTCP